MSRLTKHPLAGLALAFTLAAPACARAQDVGDIGQLAEFIQWGGVAASLIVFAIAIVLLRGLEQISRSLCERFVSRRPTIQSAESISRFVVYLVAVIIAFRLSLRMDATALTVVGGGLAFAVGFAMRDLVAAVIAGVIIMIDRPFQVGDRVEYAGQYGDVIKIGLRSVRLNTLDHNIITIPNNKVLTDVTSSGNYGALEMQVPMEVFIGPDENVDLAMVLLQEACATSPYAFLARPTPVFVKQTLQGNIFLIQIKARPYVFDAKYEKSFETDVMRRVIRAFRAHGISGPSISLAGQSLQAAVPG